MIKIIHYINVLALFIILYTVIFYPLLLILFSKKNAQKFQEIMVLELPSAKVSHVVAVFNGENSIAEKIDDVLASTPSMGFHQLIIVTDGCTDNTARVVAADTRVILIELLDRVGKEAALIEGVKVAEGDIVVFSDLDTRIQPGSVTAMLANFARQDVGVVSSVDRIISDKHSVGTLFIRFEMMLRRYESYLSSCVGVSGSFFAARKNLCEKLSGRGCSDLEIVMISVRCGYRAITDQKAIGYYSVCNSDFDEFERKKRTIVHGVTTLSSNRDLFSVFKYGWFSWQLFSHKVLRWVSAILVVWLLVYFSLEALLLSPYLTAMAFLIFGIFMVAMRKTNIINTSFFFISIASVFAAVIAIFSGNRYRTWKPSKKMNLIKLNVEELPTSGYEHLMRHGFLHIKNVLSVYAVEEAKYALDLEFSKERSSRSGAIIEHGASDSDVGAIQELNHLLKSVPALRQSRLLTECNSVVNQVLGRRARPSFDHAIYKQPQGGSILWHQDQAYKDTVKKMRSVHVWIPLQDTNPSMGCMQYVPGSHQFGNLSHTRHISAHTLSVKIKDKACEPAVQVAARLGDVIIHLPQTLHSSLPNHSDEIRKAWIIHFNPYGYWEPFLPENLWWHTKNKIRLLLGCQ